MEAYAGIGSRKTPKEVLKVFIILAKHGLILRSGHAPGADVAFEYGCDAYNGYKEIHLPWKGFEKSTSKLYPPSDKAYEIASTYHKQWGKISDGAKKLIARDGHQVLGFNMDTPVKFVLCWTKDGKREGGTGQALRIAEAYKIPIFDAGAYTNMNKYIEDIKTFLVKNNLIYEEK